MYRKNTASQYIYFCLVNATTGGALTGATVTAYRALDNGAQASATGTTTELANGQYRFNLSQADTNAENGSYLFVATNAVPVEKTVVFTSANPSDAAAFGLSNLDAAISSRMATYTQPTGFLAATFPATVSSFAGGAVASVTAGVTVTTNNDKTGYTVSTVSDKTGYSLTAGTGLGNQTANSTGNLSGSVGSVTAAVTLDAAARVKLDASQPDYAPALAATALSTAVWTNTIAGRIDVAMSTLATAASITTMRGADNDTLKTLSDQIDALSVNTGTGARTVTITVNDGTTVLQNARVRLTEGANTYTGLTNVSGVVTFNLDDATYTVGITKSGYSYAGTTLVVDGTETRTYSMTVISVTPPNDPALCAVTFHLYDQYGADMASQPVDITFVKWETTATDTPPVLSVPPVQTTNNDGVVSVNLFREATYKIVYGNAPYTRRVDVTIPDAGTYTVEI